MANTPRGLQLTKDLGLEQFKYIEFQKTLNLPLDIYIVTVDSMYPGSSITYAELKNIESSFLSKIKKMGNVNFAYPALKLSPPIPLREFRGNIASNAIIMIRDLAGEYRMDKMMYEPSPARK
jgi:hypothetical protein